MRKKLLFILTIIFLPTIIFANTLKVGVWHNPPLSVISENSVSGFLPDIFKFIANKEGIKYKIIKGSWNELYNKLKSGKIDIFMPIGFTEQRLKYMSFSKVPLFTNWGELIVNKNSAIKNLVQLNGKKIVALKDDIFLIGENSLPDILKLYKIKAKIIKLNVANYENLAKLISENQADAALVSKITIPHI